MSRHIIIHENIPSQFKFNAGSKARNDIESIAKHLGYDVFFVDDSVVPDRENLSVLSKLKLHATVYLFWIKQLMNIPDNSKIIIQFPVFVHTFFFDQIINQMHKKGCRVIAIIHDLEILRLVNSANQAKRFFVKRSILEEKRILPEFDMLVVHNDLMKEKVINLFSIEQRKIKSIDIFDYLIPGFQNKIISSVNYTRQSYSVIIAGNLDVEKSGYIYKLPSNCNFELFGPNYSGPQKDNIHYNGVYPPDELPFYLNGDFGLVWDGPESTTCCGPTGEYLKCNNPHKTSLYLACGIPVIVWEEAAMANFIIEHKCGIVISSLNELYDVISLVTKNMYEEMKNNAETIGAKLRNGEFTQKAINEFR